MRVASVKIYRADAPITDRLRRFCAKFGEGGAIFSPCRKVDIKRIVIFFS